MRMGGGEEDENGKVDSDGRIAIANDSEAIDGSNRVTRPLGQGRILCRTELFMTNYTAKLLHKKENLFSFIACEYRF